MGHAADLEALGKRKISCSCWESNHDSSVSCIFTLSGCSIQALCIYSMLDKTCATVAVSVNRAVPGVQFPSEDIATHTHTHTHSRCYSLLWSTYLPTPNPLMAGQLHAAFLLKLHSNRQRRQAPPSCFSVDHADFDLRSLICS